MDIARPDLKKQKKRRLIMWAGVAVVVIAVAAVLVYRLKPAAPTVDRSTVWTRHGKTRTDDPAGPRLDGLLVPREDSYRVDSGADRRDRRPHSCVARRQVTPDTVLLDLADPQLQQELLNAQLALKAAQADYKSLQATLQSTLMDKKTAAAQVNADYTQDQLQAQTDKALCDLGVMSGLACQQVEEHGRST